MEMFTPELSFDIVIGLVIGGGLLLYGLYCLFNPVGMLLNLARLQLWLKSVATPDKEALVIRQIHHAIQSMVRDPEGYKREFPYQYGIMRVNGCLALILGGLLLTALGIFIFIRALRG